ncbi:MAG: macro domain-containing protein [Leptospirales bacterium]|nr:macro domain-containing protein [Leptospirales bacterium]
MSIKIINGNLFDTDANIICHQVNCKGVMGSGVAKQVKERYPQAYEAYKKLCDETRNKRHLLGTAQAVFINNPDKTVYNLFGQERYGSNGLFTSYEALQECFTRVVRGKFDGDTYAMPFRIGCDRGGGDWDIVYKMLEETFAGCDLSLYKLGVDFGKRL